MEAETQALVVRATKGLKLRDISLYDARFSRPTVNSGDVVEEVFQQHKRGVAYTVGDAPENGAEKSRLLQIRVSLGTRAVQKMDQREPVVLFEIEAEYLVEYLMTEDVPDDAIKAFAEFNAIHNVWPFWRQHVFDLVDRGRLPRLTIPLFEGIVL